VLTAILVVAAFVAGLTGAWSPCGFSMVSTLGEHARGRAATLAACAAFVPGAVLGGVLTFGSLAGIGALLGGADVALIAAAVLAASAALAEAAGVRIAPQIRRQVPEHWRRVLPLPVAAAGYGVLLGIGFTTYVLTFAVPALAGVALAVGDVGTGVLVGVAFALGRSLPVVVLAPVAREPFGLRATELMAERPGILRGFRAADALALAACAVALGAESASAQTRAFLNGATDPSAVGTELAWKVPGGPAFLRAPGGDVPIQADRVAIGGGRIATVVGPELRVAERATGARVLTLALRSAAPVDGLAVSDRWVVLRRRQARGWALHACAVPAGTCTAIARYSAPTRIGRPAIDGDRVVYDLSGRTQSRIDEVDLAAGARATLRRDSRRTFAHPSLSGEQLLYVETTQFHQALVLGLRTEPRGRTLLAIAPAITADKGFTTKHGPHRPGIRRPQRLPKEGPAGTTTTLWTTALAADAAYVTRLRERDGVTRAALLRVGF
jgi:cytochrome c biogenesis protein CcdA